MHEVNQKALKGTYLLTLAALIAKVLSAFYRIPFQNLVGNRGFYVYQQIYPIYGIGMTLALNGLPAFISKLVAENEDANQRELVIRDTSRILIMTSISIFMLLYFGSFMLADLMGDILLAPVIKSVSSMFLLMPYLSMSRGYYQGILDMRPTAYSQVIEQFIRVSIIILVAYLSSKMNYDPYKTGTLAMLSSPIAGLVALIVILPKSFFLFNRDQFQFKINKRLAKKLLIEGGTICLITAIMVILQLVDSFSVVNGLKQMGKGIYWSQNVKGIYDRAQTLVQLGLVLGVSASSAMLPTLTLLFKKQREDQFWQLTKNIFHVNLAIAMAIWVGLTALMPEINRLLFKTASLDLTISIYCFSIILVTILLIYNSILLSRNIYLPLIKAVLLGIIVKVLITKLMVIKLGIIGASLSTVLSLASMLLLLKFHSGVKVPKIVKSIQVTKLIFLLLFMGIGVRLVANGLNLMLFNNLRINSFIILLINIPLGVIIFILGSLKLKLFTLEEWNQVPLLKKFIRIRK